MGKNTKAQLFKKVGLFFASLPKKVGVLLSASFLFKHVL